MINSNIDLLNNRIFESTGFSGTASLARYAPQRFSNFDAVTDAGIMGTAAVNYTLGRLNGAWIGQDSWYTNPIHIKDGVVLDHPMGSPTLKVTVNGINLISVPFDENCCDGVLSEDGNTIIWSNGNKWKRTSSGSGNQQGSGSSSGGNTQSGSGATAALPGSTPVDPVTKQPTGVPAASGTFDPTILAFQQWVNTNYHEGLKEDGIAADSTRAAFGKYSKQYTAYLEQEAKKADTFLGMPATVGYIVTGVAALAAIGLLIYAFRRNSSSPAVASVTNFVPKSRGMKKLVPAS